MNPYALHKVNNPQNQVNNPQKLLFVNWILERPNPNLPIQRLCCLATVETPCFAIIRDYSLNSLEISANLELKISLPSRPRPAQHEKNKVPQQIFRTTAD